MLDGLARLGLYVQIIIGPARPNAHHERVGIVFAA